MLKIRQQTSRVVIRYFDQLSEGTSQYGGFDELDTLIVFLGLSLRLVTASINHLHNLETVFLLMDPKMPKTKQPGVALV